MKVFFGTCLIAFAIGSHAMADLTGACTDRFANNPALQARCMEKMNSCAAGTNDAATIGVEVGDINREIQRCQVSGFESLVNESELEASELAREQREAELEFQRESRRGQAGGAPPPAQSQGTNAAPGTTAVETDARALSALAQKCEQDKTEAKNFCGNPIKYSTDGGVSDETANVALQLGMMAGTVAKGDEGVNGLCNMAATTGAGMAGLNGTFAARCSSFINDCEASCDTALKAAKANATMFAAEIRAITDDIGVCSAQRRKAAELTSQASVQATGAMMSKLCANASKATTTGSTITPPVVPVPTGDCTGANATSPLCRTPTPGGGYTGGGGAGFDYAGGGSSGSEAGMNVGDLDSATTQSAKTDPTVGAASANAGVPNGGGQMLGGQDSGGAGGGDEGGRGGGGGGQNANVLQGERSGGGYSVSPGGALAASGGWGGYGAGGSGDTEKRDKFDLSKYLPGGKNAPARGPAGLGRAGAEIAAAHEDIFKKISDRVQVVCRTNRLMDCN